MEIPHRGSRPALALPEIYVHDANSSDRFRNSSRFNSYKSAFSPSTSPGPMSIPNARDPVPPPLPPPRHIADIEDGGSSGPDIAWQWSNFQEGSGWGGSVLSVASGSSLYGGSFASRNSIMDNQPEAKRRTSSTSTVKSMNGLERRGNPYPRVDEGYASLSGTSSGSNRSKYHDSTLGRAGFQSSVHDKFRTNAQAYDKSLLQKLDARKDSDNNTAPRSYSNAAFSTSLKDGSPTSRMALETRYPLQLKPLSLPIISNPPGLSESPIARWADIPLSSATSPGSPYSRFGAQNLFDHRSPSDAADTDSVATRESYDQRISPDHDADFQMEETGLRRLHIEDYAARSEVFLPGGTAGQKRRASSPPVDECSPLYAMGSQGDLFRRRESASRTASSPRFHSTSGSMSSTASGPRSNSYVSSLSVAASSITSMNSYGRLSPGGISPTPTDGTEFPYVTSLSLNTSPRRPHSRTKHERTLSESRPLMTSRKISDGPNQAKQKPTPSTMQGVFICECCPKKPKKFESQAELNSHEQEKQYECAYCRNRFKNKNEAERHQNSLHLRRHSWSCAALSEYAAAIHMSPTRPNEADTCGYCGEDFPRSGVSSPSPSGHQIAIATEEDWEVRIMHLQELHKFGECNHAKKFFRADHFRQHLKHSHAGTSGKWTNMLENACMKDEPLPDPIRVPGRVFPGSSSVGRINEEDELL